MNITVLSRREIEAMDRIGRPHAVISITDPTEPGFPGDGNDNRAKLPSDSVAVLRLRFWDCDPQSLRRHFDHWVQHEAEAWNVPSVRGRVETQITLAMTEAHAAEIRAFLDTLWCVSDLLIHCEAGISRSAGVAAGLVASGRGFRWANENARGFRPNAHVKSLVVAALREGASP